MFVLKTRAITGVLVPALGQHTEYTELVSALKDATTLAQVYGETFYIIGERDEVLAECYGFQPVPEQGDFIP